MKNRRTLSELCDEFYYEYKLHRFRYGRYVSIKMAAKWCFG